MSDVHSFRDLKVYQKLTDLHLKVHNLSMNFPKFELYELGAQVRRASNSAPAQLAEGWGSRHTNMYIESINRSLGEVRESQHHLAVAKEKHYITSEQFAELDEGYDHCGRMLERLHQSLSSWKDTTRTGHEIRESRADYPAPLVPSWSEAACTSLCLADDDVLPIDKSRTPSTQHRTPSSL